jgi:hypothetical protein
MASFNEIAVLQVSYQDTWGNSGFVEYEIINDQTPPVVSVSVSGDEFQDGKLASLEELNITAVDNSDENPVIEVVLEDIATSSTTLASVESDGSLTVPSEEIWTLPAEIAVTVTATDKYGNETVVEKKVDNTPPAITFFESSAEFSDGELDGFDLFNINLRDGFDLSPDITSMTLNDGTTAYAASIESELQVGASVNFKISPPAISPSIDAIPCVLTVNAQDQYGNQSTATLEFDYKLRTIGTADGGKLLIPAIAHAFTRKDGRQALISEPAYDRNGDLLTGTHSLQASLTADAGGAIVLNGVTVEPGQSVVIDDDYDFSASAGIIELPAMAAITGQASSGLLMIQPQSSTAPTLVVDVEAWTLDLELSADTWTPKRFFEVWSVGLTQATESPCQLSSNQNLAESAALFDQPVALVTLTSTEPGLELDRETPPSLSGRMYVEGEREVSYVVEMIDSNGDRIKMAEGAQFVTAAPVGDISWTPDQDLTTLYQKVGYIEFGLKQQSGESLNLTTNKDRAVSYAEYGRLLGVVDWVELPAGIAQDELYEAPALEGSIDTLGDHRLAWRVSIVDKSGQEYELASQETVMGVVEPPAPVLTFQTNNEVLADGSVVASIDGGQAGILTTTVPRRAGKVTIDISGIGDQTLSSTYSTGTSIGSKTDITFNKIVSVESGELWGRSVVHLSAYYTDMPEIRTDEALEIFRSPPEGIALYLSSDSEALDTSGVPYSVSLGDLESYTSVVYDPVRHGQWDVKIVQVSGSTHTDLVGTQPMIEGESNGIISHEAGTLSLMAIASIVSPDGLYEREINSNRQYSTIYIGTSPEASIVTQYYTGQAPLRVVLGLTMDTNNRIVLGDVQWEYSVDSGETWTVLPTDTIPTRLTTTFDVGKYQVRCLAENSKTGEKGYTETIEIHAYNVPTLSLDGSTTVFVGGQVNIEATTMFNNQEVDAVVEWRDLYGEVLQEGPVFTAVPTAPSSYYLVAYARLPESPADATSAWTYQRYNVSAKDPVSPRGMLSLPRYMEAGTEYPIKTQLGLPYTGMSPDDYPIIGEWVLPDGTVIPGDDTTYIPTVADAEQGIVTFKYNVWIAGFKEQTTTTLQQRVSVGQYIWPDFEILQSQTFEQAPSAVTLQANPVNYTGRLESPVYTWTLPPSASIKYDYGSRIVATFAEPGDFTVGVHVTDARGQERDVTTLVQTVEPDPFVIETVMSPSNKWYHGPLDVTVYAKASGGHPQDRMVSFEFFLDGVQVEATNIATIKGLDPGNYVLRVEGTSILGATAVHEETIAVLPNMPPVCEVATTFLASTVNPQYALQASCTDSDGYMVSYRWLIDGNVVGYSNKVGVKEPTSGFVTVDLLATDNTGGEFTTSITLEPHVSE